MAAVMTAGGLDLRGFLGLDPAVWPGCETLRHVARLKGFGSWSWSEPPGRER